MSKQDSKSKKIEEWKPKSQQKPSSKMEGSMATPPTFEEMAVLIANNERYMIQDAYHRKGNGEIAYTESRTVLHPTKMTRGHFHDDGDELYTVISGGGYMIIQGHDKATVSKLEPGSKVLVESGDWHQVVNPSDSIDLIVETMFKGEPKRPPILPDKKQ